jgi:hypothetical protein
MVLTRYIQKLKYDYNLVNVINLTQIDQVTSNHLLVVLYQDDFAYCYQWVNVITLGLAQSDHIRQLLLYKIKWDIFY